MLRLAGGGGGADGFHHGPVGGVGDGVDVRGQGPRGLEPLGAEEALFCSLLDWFRLGVFGVEKAGGWCMETEDWIGSVVVRR